MLLASSTRHRESYSHYAEEKMAHLPYAHAGSDVALSDNGDRLVVTCTAGNGIKHPLEVVYVYTRNESQWHLEEILRPR
jgi:hypothetical protein